MTDGYLYARRMALEKFMATFNKEYKQLKVMICQLLFYLNVENHT